MYAFDNERIETGVDKLIDFLRGKEKVDIKDAADTLGVPVETIQVWTDFLVEENIVGLEYKLTKPYIYLIKDLPGAGKKELISIKDYKDEFSEKARKLKLPEVRIKYLWRTHLMEEVEKSKEFFYKEAKRRNLPTPDNLWDRYKEKLGGILED